MPDLGLSEDVFAGPQVSGVDDLRAAVADFGRPRRPRRRRRCRSAAEAPAARPPSPRPRSPSPRPSRGRRSPPPRPEAAEPEPPSRGRRAAPRPSERRRGRRGRRPPSSPRSSAGGPVRGADRRAGCGQVGGAAAAGRAGRGHALDRRRRPRAARCATSCATPSSSALGAEVAPDGALDRAAIAERVFGDDEARAWLEGLLWPRVGERVGAWRSASTRPTRAAAAVVEVPLLFESGMESRLRRARSPWSPTRRCASERAAARGHAAVAERAGRQLVQAGKGAQSGLHGAQRRLARGVEADAVPRTCQTRTDVSSHAARIARRRPRARVTAAPPDRVVAVAALLGAVVAGGRDRRRPARRGGARDHAAAAPRRHHPPAGRRQGPRPGADRAVIYEESRFRDQTSHAGARGLMQITPDTADFIARRSGGVRSSRRTSPRRRSTSPTAPSTCAT